MKYFPLTLLLLSLLSTASASDILMRFWANQDYVRAIGSDGKPRLETYTFYIGKYYPSAYETEEEAISFDSVARILVEQLGKQNYLMTEDPKQADYLLMINWGQTTPEADVEETEYESFGEDDTSIVVDEVPEAKKRENAHLLGVSKLYNMSQYSLKKQLLEEAIVQDRYFINIYAVSLHDIRNRDKGKKGPKVKATWECQLSVPTNHSDPLAAFKSMASTGSSYFGQNVRDLTFMKEGIKQGVVTIGEIRFLDSDEGDTNEEATEE